MEAVRHKKKPKSRKKVKKDKEATQPEDIFEEVDAVNDEHEKVVTESITIPSQIQDDEIPSVPPVTASDVQYLEDPIQEFRTSSPVASSNNAQGDLIVFDSLPGNQIANNERNCAVVDEINKPLIKDDTSSEAIVDDDSEVNYSLSNQIANNAETVTQPSISVLPATTSSVIVSADVDKPIATAAMIPQVPQIEVANVLYPRLDSLVSALVYDDPLLPYSEDDLALLYPNAQLAANTEFIERFIKESQQSEHPLYELLTQYLKSRLALRTVETKLENLKKRYSENQGMIWNIVTNTISSIGRCRDNSKVTHSHSHKYAEYDREAAVRTEDCLKQLRITLQEEYSIRSYSAQLACIHVEYYLHHSLQLLPGLISLPELAPVTGYIPSVPPGCLDKYTNELRNCISVLFMFERRPQMDNQFSQDCRKWLNTMLNALLRIASLPDHLFILNHLLRCPPGVAKWGSPSLQPLSPLTHQGSLRFHDQSDEYLAEWKSFSSDICFGGPIIDHWVTMLATLLQPIVGREEFLSHMITPSTGCVNVTDRQESQNWTFIEEDIDEEADTDENDSYMLLESDLIAFLDQFSITDIFKALLGCRDGTMSSQVMQLIAFCTCLIRLFGTVFNILRSSSYKEFVKQVGRTIRQTVHFVADHWCSYRSWKLSKGESLTDLPQGEDPTLRYTLKRLQIEFDQFVLRATQWILTAHKLGAWQFMADMPYGSLSLITVWKILWTLYHNQLAKSQMMEENQPSDRRGSVLAERLDLDLIPETITDIIQSIQSPSCHSQFVDVLMKTYTSESVFLLTTFVNMARSRLDNNPEECNFINVVSQEIFQFTQVEEYSRDAYNKTGHSLMGSIATVHPFIISTILECVKAVIDDIGENCILLFKELPLHLWIPSEHDLGMVCHWLVSCSLESLHHLFAKVVISGLNWGVKEASKLFLPPSFHRVVALSLVEAWSHHLSSQPGGWNYNPLGTIGKYASSIRSLLSTDQSDLASWMWEITLMLKLHHSQFASLSLIPLSPKRSHEYVGAKDPSVYKQPSSDVNYEAGLLDMNDSHQLRDAVQHEGLLAYYVSLCLTDIGSDCHQFIIRGLPMLHKMVEQGYYLPTLKVLGNVTPLMFKNRKMFVNEQSFIQLIISVVNSDANQYSLKDKLSWSSPSQLILQRFSALITAQLHHWAKTPSDSELILIFWLEVLLCVPGWLKESNVLYILNNICMATFGNKDLEKVLCKTFVDQYIALQPLQPKSKKLISSVTSSVLSIVGQDAGPPSIFNSISSSAYPWLSYYTLCSEQQFEVQEGIWKTLLVHLKTDNISVDVALKKTLGALGHTGSTFVSSHLSIYRWAELCTSVDSTFVLLPLVWQRFFSFYLQRPVLNDNLPERGSLGLKFFSTNRSQSIRKSMKGKLSSICRDIQKEMADFQNSDDVDRDEKEIALLVDFLPKILKYYQTLRMWLEEPRLHEEALYLPSLPPQYDSNRLSKVFHEKQDDWIDLIRVWEIASTIKVMIYEWGQVASYQKPLTSLTESQDKSPNSAVARIEKRLQHRSTKIPPSNFHMPLPPFSLLKMEVLLSKDELLSTVMSDINYIAQQGREYSEKLSTLVALDSEYISGIPDLYSNQPRQFHVSVPCHSKFNRSHVCTGPATIVFRFDELTAHPHWEERIKHNRQEHSHVVNSLSHPIPSEFCKAVARTEHVVGQLSKLCSEKDSKALSNGVALFYETLKFITSETKQFQPSCQFLSSCVEILGQEFIQRDASQTPTILQLLLAQRSLGNILAPLFDPNLNPSQFLVMYPNVVEISVKEGPNIAFSILSKFNVAKWLMEYSPSTVEYTELLKCIFHGIIYCGSDPPSDVQALLGGYLNHLTTLVNHQFPLLFSATLEHIIEGSDTNSITPRSWEALLLMAVPNYFTGKPNCRLGLQLILECSHYVANHYHQKRLYTKDALYELMNEKCVPVIVKFIEMLATSMTAQYLNSVELGNTTASEAIKESWLRVIDLFTPWICPMHSGEGSEILIPCKVEHISLFVETFEVFVNVISSMEKKFMGIGCGVLGLMWPYYCENFTLPDIPYYIMQCYHTNLVNLPWNLYAPDITAMDLMMKLRIDTNFPKSCFVFLGDIFPVFDWIKIATHYCNDPDPAVPVQFHTTFLQLLIMLAAEPEVMHKKNTCVPELMSEAKNFAFHYIDFKTYNDILLWQKNNCECTTVLQTGSMLSLSLRLLKVAGSFPLNDDNKPLTLHVDGWKKRQVFIRLLVELISLSSQHKETHSLSYGDIIAFMIQSIVDIVLYEPASSSSTLLVSLLQEVLNIFNTCHPSETFVSSLCMHINACLSELPSAQMICLPTISAACCTLVSIPLMVHVVEDIIKIYFSHLPIPTGSTVPNDGYGWGPVSGSLCVPEAAYKEFSSICIQEFACLCLHTRLLQQFPLCTGLDQELGIASQIVDWCTKFRPKPNEEYKMFLLWEKAFSLLIRQIKYGGNVMSILPSFTVMANNLQRFGEDKATEGLLGAIGLGRKSSYCFKLVARALATFIYCQMPVDSSQSTIPRLAPHAPGHVKDPSRYQSGTPTIVGATKQADQACAGLESLLSNKAYLHLKDYVTYSLEYVNDLQNTLLNVIELLVYLVVNLYPTERCLDTLRVLQN